jgi:hypothetical protein
MLINYANHQVTGMYNMTILIPTTPFIHLNSNTSALKIIGPKKYYSDINSVNNTFQRMTARSTFTYIILFTIHICVPPL